MIARRAPNLPLRGSATTTLDSHVAAALTAPSRRTGDSRADPRRCSRCRWQPEHMTRDELRAALAVADGEGAAVCLAALDDPDVAVLQSPDGHAPVPVDTLLRIYRRRARHAERIGLPSVGLDETVAALETTQYVDLRLELVNGGVRLFPACTVFLAPDRPEVVAAVVVTGRAPTR